MSKERARAREAREAARATEKAAAAKQAAKTAARQERLAALKPSMPKVPRRQRRYGALPTQYLLGLAFGWLVTQWVFWQLFGDARSRFGLALISVLALPLVVVLFKPKGSR